MPHIKFHIAMGLTNFPPDEATVSDKADASCPALRSAIKQVIIKLLRNILRLLLIKDGEDIRESQKVCS